MKYAEIQEAKKAIETMKYGLQFYKDESRKHKQIALINTFIKLVNAAEALADKSSDRNLVDVLLVKWFEGEYNKAQHNGEDGFVSAQTLNALRSSFGMSIKLGATQVVEDLATQMAVDTLANSDLVTEQDAAVPLTKDEKLLKYVGACKEHWVKQLNTFLEYCHNQRVVA